MRYNNFYIHLRDNLPTSTGARRKYWAEEIVNYNFSIKQLSKLLFEEQKIATRFLWLLSDIGEINQNVLLESLPFLLSLNPKIKHLNTDASFANYWLIVGIPIKNEAKAISLLFEWIQSSNTNVTTKSRSITVLLKLSHKYPDLKQELKFSIERLLNKHSSNFNKKLNSVLIQLK